MKKILIVASVYSHIAQFHTKLIEKLNEEDYTIHIAGRNNLKEKPDLYLPKVDKMYDLDFTRSPFTFKNISVYKKMKLIINSEKYDIIYTHTPAASVITRMAAKKTRKNNKTKVIYMAHGFHFYEGAPLKNWLIYYPIEKKMSRHTDIVITINNEDYNLAKLKFKKTRVVKSNGVGIDFSKFDDENDDHDIRKGLDIPDNAMVITTIGELNDNKNQAFIIENIIDNLETNNIYYLIVGNGPNEKKYERIINEKKINHRVLLLGYRRDISSILKRTDLLISASKREGLGINLIEAMRMQVPIMASNNRGHRDIITNYENGLLFNLENEDFKNKFYCFINKTIDFNQIISKAYTKTKLYSSKAVNTEIFKLFSLESNFKKENNNE